MKDAAAPDRAAPQLNRWVLTAQLIERSAVRYTPAGLPAIELLLRHASTVSEDGQPRQVSIEIKATAIGAITRPVGAMALGSTGEFAGFLAQTRNARGVRFHVTAMAPVSTLTEPV